MSYAASHPSSRLIETLHSLTMLDGRLPHAHFVTTLGKFVDFSGAISLSELLGQPSSRTNNSSLAVDSQATITIKEHYIQVRGEIMQFITQSFIVDHYPNPLRVPQASDENFSHEDLGLSAYQRFYRLHQSEMEARLLKLQNRCRQQIASCSAKLKQLAALDRQLSDILSSYSRKALNAVPALLSKRFQYHCSESSTPSATRGLPIFLSEMQTLLLAELEIRLQPTLGLIEALTIEEEKSIR